MKKTLQILAASLCCLLLPVAVFAEGEGEGDSNDPPIPPGPSATSIQCTQTSIIEVVFYQDAEAAIEVVAEDGSTVYHAGGTVAQQSHVVIDAKQWRKGCYLVLVKLHGKLVNWQYIQLNKR